MKKLLLAVALLIQSCANPTLLVNKEDLQRIPYGSTKVVSMTSLSPDESFSTIAKAFAKSGCPVKSDKTAMQIICDGKSVEGGTQLKALAFFEEDPMGTKVTMSGEWGLDASGQVAMSAFSGSRGMVSATNQIRWEGIKGTKPCIAFQHLILLSLSIPDARMKYEK